MWKPITNRRRDYLARALLALLLFGAYIPSGFMPAAGTPFLLQLCPVAGPMPPSAEGAMDGAMAMSAPMPMPANMPMPSGMAMPAHMAMPMHHHPANSPHHGGPHGHFEGCPFGCAPGAGPLLHVSLFSPSLPVSASLEFPPEPPPPAVRPARAHQPRGPPSPA